MVWEELNAVVLTGCSGADDLSYYDEKVYTICGGDTIMSFDVYTGDIIDSIELPTTAKGIAHEDSNTIWISTATNVISEFDLASEEFLRSFAINVDPKYIAYDEETGYLYAGPGSTVNKIDIDEQVDLGTVITLERANNSSCGFDVLNNILYTVRVRGMYHVYADLIIVDLKTGNIIYNKDNVDSCYSPYGCPVNLRGFSLDEDNNMWHIDGSYARLRSVGTVPVWGLVSDVDGNPIKGAKVSFSSDSTISFSCYIDHTGKYKTSLIPGYTYIVIASKSGYESQSESIVITQ